MMEGVKWVGFASAEGRLVMVLREGCGSKIKRTYLVADGISKGTSSLETFVSTAYNIYHNCFLFLQAPPSEYRAWTDCSQAACPPTKRTIMLLYCRMLTTIPCNQPPGQGTIWRHRSLEKRSCCNRTRNKTSLGYGIKSKSPNDYCLPYCIDNLFPSLREEEKLYTAATPILVICMICNLSPKSPKATFPDTSRRKTPNPTRDVSSHQNPKGFCGAVG